MSGADLVGEMYDLEIGAVAHGGHCVARHDGRVVFVRHTLPGERVRAVVTDGCADDRYLRADAIEVLRLSANRVPAPCPYAGPGRCGGCDWQHVTLAAQRALKAAVVREQLERLGGRRGGDPLLEGLVVEELPDAPDGLGWRTRVRFTVDADGRAGLHPHRSHDVVPLARCLIAHPGTRDGEVLARRWEPGSSVAVVTTSTGEHAVVTDRSSAAATVHERAVGHDFHLAAGGFWQVHPAAADVLVDAALDAVAARPGETALDLYAGVGLFAVALGDAVGPGGRVIAVEQDRASIQYARRNVANAAVSVSVESGRVDRVLLRLRGQRRLRADAVVLDPPRAGAGRRVVELVAATRARSIAYVACDPAALARDVRLFAAEGYRLAGLRAFDLFPMSHHVECVARLERTS